MTARIARFEPASAEEWDEIHAECAYSTWFHSRTWAELWRAHDPACVPDPRLVRFEDGTRALLPFSVRRSARGLVRQIVSSPGGTYGGWIAPEPLTAEQSAALAALVSGQRDLVWRLNPYDPIQRSLPLAECASDTTHALRLAADYESISEGFNASHRRNIRRGERRGVEVRIAKSEDDWRAYYGVYEDSLRRWGARARSRYGWPLFRAVARHEADGIRLWLAEREGRVIAGSLCLSAGRHIVDWHRAVLEEEMPSRPVHLLMAAAIRDACRRGFEWFDFNPSGGIEGVAEFKRRFGAEELPCPLVRRRSRASRWLPRLLG